MFYFTMKLIVALVATCIHLPVNMAVPARLPPDNGLSCEDFESAMDTGRTFLVPDANYCDVYLRCTPNDDGGHYESQKGSCPSGQVLDDVKCRPLAEVSCEGRENFHNAITADIYSSTLTKPATRTRYAGLPADSPVWSTLCIEPDGLFEVPDECPKYVECFEGRGYVRQCPSGTVFDASQSRCEHESFAGRRDCAALAATRSISCPPRRDQLRFGSHERLADPTTCVGYFVCSVDRIPRPASCTPPLVFDAESAFCVEQTKVPECAGTYSEAEVKEYAKRKAQRLAKFHQRHDQ